MEQAKIDLRLEFSGDSLEKRTILRLEKILKLWSKFVHPKGHGHIVWNWASYTSIACKNLFEGFEIQDVFSIQSIWNYGSFENWTTWKSIFESKWSKIYKNYTEAIKNNANNILKLLTFMKSVVYEACSYAQLGYNWGGHVNQELPPNDDVLSFLAELNDHLDFLVKDLNFEWKKAEKSGLFSLSLPLINKISQDLSLSKRFSSKETFMVKENIEKAFSATISQTELKQILKDLSNPMEKIRGEIESKNEFKFLSKGKNGLWSLLNNLDIRHSNSFEWIVKEYPEIKNQDDYFQKLKETRNLLFYIVILFFS